MKCNRCENKAVTVWRDGIVMWLCWDCLCEKWRERYPLSTLPPQFAITADEIKTNIEESRAVSK